MAKCGWCITHRHCYGKRDRQRWYVSEKGIVVLTGEISRCGCECNEREAA